MADIFKPKPGNATVQPGAAAPADAAARLAAIRLMFARLAQNGGAPQTFGNYLQGGPRRMPAGLIGSVGDELMKSLMQPHAFQRGPTTQTVNPPRPSTFQDAASGLVTLALLTRLLGQGYDVFGRSAAGTGATPSTGPLTSGDPALDTLLGQQYGAGGGAVTYLPTSGGDIYAPQVPGGDIGAVPADYPGMVDSTSSTPWWNFWS